MMWSSMRKISSKRKTPNCWMKPTSRNGTKKRMTPSSSAPGLPARIVRKRTPRNLRSSGNSANGCGPVPCGSGEQDPLQSPVVLGLFGGTLLLLLVAGILWFIIGRQSSQKAFDAAQEKLDTGQYAQAIQLFEKFQNDYPTHKLLPKARIGQGKATILQYISGGSPDWPKGLEELQNFIRDFKDQEEFDELKPKLREYAKEIAVGSAKTAAQARERSLLKIPPQALIIAQRYTSEEEAADNLAKEIDRLLIVANDAIVKQETYDAAVAQIEQALKPKSAANLGRHARPGRVARPLSDIQSNPKSVSCSSRR